MSGLKFLVLTDHGAHSAQNSIYAIVRDLTVHEDVESVHVASRSIEANSAFFEGDVSSEIEVSLADKDFAYSDDGQAYQLRTKLVCDFFDAIIMRVPRPVTDYFLDQLAENYANKYIVNHPSGIKLTSSKEFLLNFKELCPPIRLCTTIDEIKEFAHEYDIVLKPLRDYGGRGIMRIIGGKLDDGKEVYDLDTYLGNLEEKLGAEAYLAMKYLKNVVQGDKRLLVVDGEILAASLRLPANDSWLCNVAMGGHSVDAIADHEEFEMVDKINAVMNKYGILMYGVDTLVGDDGKRVLSEINTMSIGGFMQAQAQTGRPIINHLVNKIIKYARI